MTDHRDLIDLGPLLARPDVWDEPAPGGDDEVVAAVVAAVFAGVAGADDASGPAQRSRTSPYPWWLTAAAVVAIVVVGLVTVVRWTADPDREGAGGDTDASTVVVLSGTDAAPGASAMATLRPTPAGLVVRLATDGLPGAPAGTFYETWLSDGANRVSAGTFHLRGGDGTVQLWAGVDDPAYTTLTVTLEPIDDDAGPSGDVRLTGTVGEP